MAKVDMADYGLSPDYAQLAAVFAPLTPGRVVSQERGSYRVASATGEQWAEPTGRFRHEAAAPTERFCPPCARNQVEQNEPQTLTEDKPITDTTTELTCVGWVKCGIRGNRAQGAHLFCLTRVPG